RAEGSYDPSCTGASPPCAGPGALARRPAISLVERIIGPPAVGRHRPTGASSRSTRPQTRGARCTHEVAERAGRVRVTFRARAGGIGLTGRTVRTSPDGNSLARLDAARPARDVAPIDRSIPIRNRRGGREH